MTPRERAETLLLTFGTLVLVLGLQWMTVSANFLPFFGGMWP